MSSPLMHVPTSLPSFVAIKIIVGVVAVVERRCRRRRRRRRSSPRALWRQARTHSCAGRPNDGASHQRYRRRRNQSCFVPTHLSLPKRVVVARVCCASATTIESRSADTRPTRVNNAAHRSAGAAHTYRDETSSSPTFLRRRNRRRRDRASPAETKRTGAPAGHFTTYVGVAPRLNYKQRQSDSADPIATSAHQTRWQTTTFFAFGQIMLYALARARHGVVSRVLAGRGTWLDAYSDPLPRAPKFLLWIDASRLVVCGFCACVQAGRQGPLVGGIELRQATD